jgi:hypothetical protein
VITVESWLLGFQQQGGRQAARKKKSKGKKSHYTTLKSM